MKPAKVVHIITGLGTGGAEMMLYKLLSGMDRRAFSCMVISLTNGGDLQDRIESLGVPVYSLCLKHPVTLLGKLAYFRQLVDSFHPDIVQGWMYHGNLAAWLVTSFKLKKSAKLFWNIRHSIYDIRHEKIATRFAIRFGAMLSRRVDTIIYNAHISQKQHYELGFNAEKSIVIPNGFDTHLFRPNPESYVAIRRELGLSEESVLVGIIGRYHPMKDHATFLGAASIVDKVKSNVYFLLVGKGVDQDNRNLQWLITNLGIKKNCFLLGERSDIPQITSALNVLVLSSFSEAFPNVIGEAMACGVPVVTTDVGDASFIVKDTGVVVPPRNKEALAKGIMDLLKQKKQEAHICGKRARNRVKKHFSLERVVKAYESLYRGTQ